MPLILASNSASGGYNVANSLRLNPGSSDYLSRTPANAGNRQIFTYSTWIKRSDLPVEQAIISCENAGPITFYFYLKTDGVMEVLEYDGSYPVWLRTGPRTFRDVSAWYHIVLAYDTTQATSSNRVKLYINGSQNTTFDVETYPSQNYNSQMNRAIETNISRRVVYNAYFFNGYMSEINFIDGQQLTPSSFGQTDPSVPSSGIWQPKAYTGSFGTNGFYLQFKNSAALGTDSSGNGNTFTANNLTSVDQSTDTPTNNFATLNSILYSTSITYSEGNLKFTNTSAGGQRMVASSIAPTTGKWYAECRVTSLGGNYPQIGVLDTSIYTMDTYVGDLVRGYGYAAHGQVYNSSNPLTTGLATYTTNDIIGVALDLDNNYVYFSKNGTFINSGIPTSGSSGTGGWAITNGYDYSFGSSSLDSGTDPVFDWNFGSPFYTANSFADGAGYGNFSYAVPSGYYSLCTKNLANFG